LLDELEPDSSTSDVLIFYINDTDEICYLQQRERYETVHATGLPGSQRYLERAFIAGDHRVHLYYSEWDEVRGRYSLGHYESELYPFRIVDSIVLASSPQALEIRPAVIFVAALGRLVAFPYIDAEKVGLLSTPQLLDVALALLTNDNLQESIGLDATPSTILIELALLLASMDTESIGLVSTPTGVSVEAITIQRNLPEESISLFSQPLLVELTA
jgi:hypothetical protein